MSEAKQSTSLHEALRELSVALRELARLRAQVAALEDRWNDISYERNDLRALNAEMLAALEPFAVEDKESLIDTLGHIGRIDIEHARNVFAKAKAAAGDKP